MSDLALALSSLRSRGLNSALSALLTAFGVMLALLITQFGHHVQSRLRADGRGIDIVAGAKGSPLQLVLSAIYHIDVPTGNIPYAEAQKWMNHRQVKAAIPLALGDNWKGHRIVGTTPDYLSHYGGDVSQGRGWVEAFEAVVGSSVDLEIGDEFAGAHGLMSGGHAHENENYLVVGVMKSTGTVLDRLILTSLDSVLQIHGLEGVEHDDEDHGREEPGHHDGAQGALPSEEDGHHHEAHASHDDDHDEPHAHDERHDDAHDEPPEHEHEHDEPAGRAEITALLITTRSPIANVNLPRSINSVSALQAANPALEMARLTSMLGVGSRSFAALSVLLISIAVLSIFAGLAGSLENRMGDLAVLRAIGFSRARIFRVITLEGMTIVVCGLTLGLLMGGGGFALLARIVPPLGASGARLSFTPQFIVVIAAVLVAGLVAAMLPALRASRIDVARQLSRSGS